MTPHPVRRLLALALALAVLAPAFAAAAPRTRAATSKPAARKPVAARTAAAGEAAPAAAVAESPETAWAKARALADQDRHDEALKVLREALAKHPDDASLLWLEAGVTGWAGRHAESVALFERMLAKHPGMAKDVRLDLATQRLWAGDPAGALRDLVLRLAENPGDDEALRLRALTLAHAERHDEAVAAYDTLLAAHPGDTELALGRARALAWGGHHAQAIEAYRAVLEREPESGPARMGLAWNENWNGNHRRAAGLFQDLLDDPQPDPEALKGLAFAEYWAGRPGRAYEPLEKYRALRPDDPEGRELETLLAREFHPGATAGFDWSSDSDDLKIFTTTFEYRIVSRRRDAIAFLWRRDHVKDGGGEREPYRLGIGHERVWTEYWASRAYVWSFKPGAGRMERGMGEAALEFRPTDPVTLTFGYEKAPVLTRESLERDVDLRTGSVALGWRLHRRLLLEAGHVAGRYSDENRTRRTSGAMEYLLLKRRRFESLVTAGTEYLAVDSDPGNGYYAPDRYVEYAPGAILRWHPRESAEIELAARVGWQREGSGETDPFHNLQFTIETPFGRGWSLYTTLETSDSNLSTASGYEQHRWAAYVSAPF